MAGHNPPSSGLPSSSPASRRDVQTAQPRRLTGQRAQEDAALRRGRDSTVDARNSVREGPGDAHRDEHVRRDTATGPVRSALAEDRPRLRDMCATQVSGKGQGKARGQPADPAPPRIYCGECGERIPVHPECPRECPVDYCRHLRFHRNCIRPHMERAHPDRPVPPEFVAAQAAVGQDTTWNPARSQTGEYQIQADANDRRRQSRLADAKDGVPPKAPPKIFRIPVASATPSAQTRPVWTPRTKLGDEPSSSTKRQGSWV